MRAYGGGVASCDGRKGWGVMRAYGGAVGSCEQAEVTWQRVCCVGGRLVVAACLLRWWEAEGVHVAWVTLLEGTVRRRRST
jgi:hypothetical protein